MIKLKKPLIPLILYTVVLVVDLSASYIYVSTFNDKNILNDVLSKSPEFKIMKQFKYCFFTTWNFMIQITFLVFAILDELTNLFDLKVSKTINGIRSYLFNTLVCPLTLFVASFFWTLYSYDRDIIFPKIMDSFYPSWMNHCTHTFILMPVLVELVLPKKYNFISFRKAFTGMTATIIMYLSLYHYIYFKYKIWLYPIHAISTWGQRLMLVLIQYFLLILFLSLGVYVQNRKRISRQAKKLH